MKYLSLLYNLMVVLFLNCIICSDSNNVPDTQEFVSLVDREDKAVQCAISELAIKDKGEVGKEKEISVIDDLTTKFNKDEYKEPALEDQLLSDKLIDDKDKVVECYILEPVMEDKEETGKEEGKEKEVLVIIDLTTKINKDEHKEPLVKKLLPSDETDQVSSDDFTNFFINLKDDLTQLIYLNDYFDLLRYIDKSIALFYDLLDDYPNNQDNINKSFQSTIEKIDFEFKNIDDLLLTIDQILNEKDNEVKNNEVKRNEVNGDVNINELKNNLNEWKENKDQLKNNLNELKNNSTELKENVNSSDYDYIKKTLTTLNKRISVVRESFVRYKSFKIEDYLSANTMKFEKINILQDKLKSIRNKIHPMTEEEIQKYGDLFKKNFIKIVKEVYDIFTDYTKNNNNLLEYIFKSSDDIRMNINESIDNLNRIKEVLL